MTTEYTESTEAIFARQRLRPKQYNNSAIAEACAVSETTVRKWLQVEGIEREVGSLSKTIGNRLSEEAVKLIRQKAKCNQGHKAKRSTNRLTERHVGRVISEIGEAAGIIVQQEDKRTGKRLKYASAHDLRRGCAERLINLGVSAETLKVVFRHSSFATTEKFYGASRSAQAAAKEVSEKFNECKKNELVGGLVGEQNRMTCWKLPS